MILYEHIYLACLLGTVISGSVSVVLFIKLDIRTAWRVLGMGGKQRRPVSIKKRQKKKRIRAKAVRTGQSTALLHPKKEDFCVIREIVLVHTDEII